MSDIQVSVKQGHELKCSLKIDVPKSRLERDIQARLRRLSKTVRLDGFRRGKVPIDVLRQRYGSSVHHEVLERLIQQTFSEAISQEKLQPAASPQVELLSDGEQGSLSYRASFELYPEVAPCDYEALTIEQPVATAEEEEVDKAVVKLLAQTGEWIKTERAATSGDKVIFDYSATPVSAAPDFAKDEAEQEEEKQPLSGEAVELELEENNLNSKENEEGEDVFDITLFTRLLLGMGAGEQCAREVLIPDSFYREDLRGIRMQLNISLNDVLESRPATLDDELLKKLGFAEGGEQALRTAVREQLQAEIDSAIKQKVKQRLFAALLKQYSGLKMPVALVENELLKLARAADDASREQVLAKLKEHGDYKPLYGEAEGRVRLGVVVSELIRHEHLEIDQQRLRATVTAIARRYPNPAEVEAQYYKEQDLLESVARATLEDQLVELLQEKATVTESEQTAEQALQADPPLFDEFKGAQSSGLLKKLTHFFQRAPN